ncbi:MAG: hypothetical protein GX591_12660 [Planctomycetes bacterium]|nr:hypothetical protein [Planctomycetota bacterium]
MKRSMQLILVLAAVGWCGAALAAHNIATPYYAPRLPVVVDGDLGEWENDYWIELDTVLSGNPEDVTSARYAVRWDDGANLLYVAVEVVDTDHRFGTPGTWAAFDALEISLDAADHGTAFGPRMGYGQHIIIDGGGLWISTGSKLLIAADLVAQWAAGPIGQTLTYEVAIVPYAFYAGWGAVDTDGRVDSDDSVEVALDNWTWMGLDVVVGSRARRSFGQLANNAVADKAARGDTLQTWLLVWATRDGACPGDASGDGVVDNNDLLILKSNFGLTEGAEWWRGDFDGDGDVDLDDYVLFHQGKAPPRPKPFIPTVRPKPPVLPEPEPDFSRSTFPDHGMDDTDRSTIGADRGVDAERSDVGGRGFDVERGF